MANDPSAKRPVSCPKCGKQLLAPQSWEGKSIKCPKCSSVFKCSMTSGQSVGGRPASARPGAMSVPRTGAMQVEMPSESSDARNDLMRFGIGAGLCIVGGVLGMVIWNLISEATGYFIPVLAMI
ncbi:MAG TPA: hypothetical protein PK402_06310, partial [Tepidisphaeraceae bacterium]|nr:hypothetical protein [Tepidisphaeraceae bacterium]